MKGRCAEAVPVKVAAVISPVGLVTPPNDAVSVVPTAVPAGGEKATLAAQFVKNGAGGRASNEQVVRVIWKALALAPVIVRWSMSTLPPVGKLPLLPRFSDSELLIVPTAWFPKFTVDGKTRA